MRNIKFGKNQMGDQATIFEILKILGPAHSHPHLVHICIKPTFLKVFEMMSGLVYQKVLVSQINSKSIKFSKFLK